MWLCTCFDVTIHGMARLGAGLFVTYAQKRSFNYAVSLCLWAIPKLYHHGYSKALEWL